MSDEQKRSIEAITSLRASFLDLVAITVVLALGINLIASGIVAAFNLSGQLTVIVGVACCILGFAYLSMKVRPANSRRFEFQGIMPIGDGKERKVFRIERYDFSEKASDYFRGLFAENKAFAKQWKESSLGLDVDVKTRTASRTNSTANELVKEALEYYVLQKLSLHLSGYFENNPIIKDDQIVRLQRKDIPSILLENRFLELFSKPMDQREAFLDHTRDDESGRVVYAYGKDGEVFDHFELILPKGTVVTRSPEAGLEIHTSRFRLRVKPVFEGYSSVFPPQFEELYMGCSFGKKPPYMAQIVFDVQFGLLSLFSVKGWEYYRWLDSFLEEMRSSFSFEDFIEDIGWSSAVSTATTIRNLKRELR